MFALGGNRGRLLAIIGLLCMFLVFFSSSPHSRIAQDADIYETHGISVDSDSLVKIPSRRKHVVVASRFAGHFDVYLAAVCTLRDVLGEEGNVDVFSPAPFNYGFEVVSKMLDLYPGETKDANDLISALNSSTFYPGEQGAMVDLLVLGTCEIDMREWFSELLAVWDARPAHKKFMVVCIVHHFRDKAWQVNIPPWAARGALRLLPIAEHVGKTFRSNFKELADDPKPENLFAMYEYINIDVHVPILDLPEYGIRSQARKPSRVAIQGSFEPSRRDYKHLFEDILYAFKHDPLSWGYLPLRHENDSYMPISKSADDVFTLHLLGHGHLDVPAELSEVVVFHVDMDYDGFYSVMQSMDVVLPAFVNLDYYDFQASSTMAMAVECDVPILATKRMRKAYGYIDDDRVTITRPQALREIHAIQVLRDGFYTHTAISPLHGKEAIYVNEALDEEIRMMLRLGWRRSAGAFRAFKLELWEQNRATIRRIVDDLPGAL